MTPDALEWSEDPDSAAALVAAEDRGNGMLGWNRHSSGLEGTSQPDLGKGPGISQGPSTNQVVFDLLKGR